MNEMWKTIKDFEMYEVSNLGRIKRIRSKVKIWGRGKEGATRTVKERILKLQINMRGYSSVTLSIENIRKTKTVHRLVAEKFIKNTDNLPHVNHINGIKTDNRAKNLEWVTPSQNIAHAIKTGLYNPKEACKRGEESNLSKLTEKDVVKIKRELSEGKTYRAIAKEFNVVPDTIGAINRGESWEHV